MDINLFDINNLPALKNFRSYMASSYDREGGNYDFGNYEQIIGEEAILLDVDGPGIITRIWSANPTGQIRIYFDGSETPQIDEDFGEFMSRLPLRWGNGRHPGNIPKDSGVVSGDEAYGRTVYCLIPFQNGCKVTLPAESSWLYYQINYHLFDEPHGLPTFSLSDIEKYLDEYTNIAAGLDWDYPNDNSDLQVVRGKISLKAGESASVFDLSSALTIRYMSFTIPYPDDEHKAQHIREKLLLRGYWDSDAGAAVEAPMKFTLRVKRTPSIKSPLAYFFMDYGQTADYNTALINKEANKYSCRFAMPVKERAVLELINASCLDIDGIEYEIVYETDMEWDNSQGYFKAIYHHEDSTFGYDKGDYADDVMYLSNFDGIGNYPVLKAWGKGHFIGCSFHIECSETPFIRALGESDEAVFVDDDPALTMWGTGNEDYINDAWGFHNAYAPLAGGNFTPSWMFGYRFHISDCIPFQKKIAFTLEHGSSNTCTAVYKSVAYYYMAEGQPNPYIGGVPPRRMCKYHRE